MQPARIGIALGAIPVIIFYWMVTGLPPFNDLYLLRSIGGPLFFSSVIGFVLCAISYSRNHGKRDCIGMAICLVAIILAIVIPGFIKD